nr:agglutinin [Quercus suber]
MLYVTQRIPATHRRRSAQRRRSAKRRAHRRRSALRLAQRRRSAKRRAQRRRSGDDPSITLSVALSGDASATNKHRTKRRAQRPPATLRRRSKRRTQRRAQQPTGDASATIPVSHSTPTSDGKYFENGFTFSSRTWAVGGQGGMEWDDGVFPAIRELHLNFGDSVIHAIFVLYQSRDRNLVWSQKHSGAGGSDSFKALRSITFYTNKAKYGPYGVEIGHAFTSSVAPGKVVGFHGRSGVYLDAIGVHMEYY